MTGFELDTSETSSEYKLNVILLLLVDTLGQSYFFLSSTI